MNERLIENRLTKSSEKSFQLPFCFMLIKLGYKVIHVTRHCGMEHGKDIIAISPNDELCVYQLKGSKNNKISLAQWKSELIAQVYQMVTGPVHHPSLKREYLIHNNYIVSNASSIEEEVFTEIVKLSDDFIRKGFGGIKTILRSDMIEMTKDIGTDFLPTDFVSFQTMLEFYLENGKANLNKEKIGTLFYSQLLVNESLGINEFKRGVSSTALLCSLAISSYANSENHVACIEAWFVFICYASGSAERYNLSFSLIEDEIEIAERAIDLYFQNLIDEILPRKDLIEGDALVDGFVYKAKVTRILGLIGAYVCIKKANKLNAQFDGEISIINKYLSSLEIWGEGAIPSFIALFFIKEDLDKSKTTQLLKLSLNTLLQVYMNLELEMAPPYLDFETVFMEAQNPKTRKFRQSTFYTMNSLIQLLVLEEQREFLSQNWKNISRTRFIDFEPTKTFEYLFWKNKKGKEFTISPQENQSWKELKASASIVDILKIPELFKMKPYFLPLFFVIYPHRFQPSLVKYAYKELMTK